jgi:hypothetical protein
MHGFLTAPQHNQAIDAIQADSKDDEEMMRVAELHACN